MNNARELYQSVTAALRLAEAESKAFPTSSIRACIVKLESAQRHLQAHIDACGEPTVGAASGNAVPEPAGAKTRAAKDAAE